MIETTVTEQAIPKVPTLPDAQKVTFVKHWTDRLFSFRVTRPASLRFRSGEFVMIGLMGDNGRPLLRAYSIASANYDEEMEFFSIKVPDGPLTSKLQSLKVGDSVLVGKKPTGNFLFSDPHVFLFVQLLSDTKPMQMANGTKNTRI